MGQATPSQIRHWMRQNPLVGDFHHGVVTTELRRGVENEWLIRDGKIYTLATETRSKHSRRNRGRNPTFQFPPRHKRKKTINNTTALHSNTHRFKQRRTPRVPQVGYGPGHYECDGCKMEIPAGDRSYQCQHERCEVDERKSREGFDLCTSCYHGRSRRFKLKMVKQL